MSHAAEAKALFVAPDGYIYPDYLVCSGIVPANLKGKPCPFSQQGRMPDPMPLGDDEPIVNARGKPGDFAPPCVTHQLASLEHWQTYSIKEFPPELLPLRMFRCRQGFWLVVPGLKHDAPTKIWNQEKSDERVPPPQAP